MALVGRGPINLRGRAHAIVRVSLATLLTYGARSRKTEPVHLRNDQPISAEEERDIEIAGPEFIKHYMTGRLAVVEQIQERILGLFDPLGSTMEAALGFTAREAVDIMKWIVDEVLRRLDEHSRFNDDLKAAWEEWRDLKDNLERAAKRFGV
jgi:hypothetical protein